MFALMSDEIIVGIDGNISQLNIKNWCFTDRLLQISTAAVWLPPHCAHG